MTDQKVQERLDEIERAITHHGVSACWVFTHMKQLVQAAIAHASSATGKENLTLEWVRDDIRKLHADRPELEVDIWADAIDDNLSAQAKDAQDAKRYRWLRNKGNSPEAMFFDCRYSPEEFDQAIDQALAAERG